MKKLFLFIVVLFVGANIGKSASLDSGFTVPPPERILASLRQDHPRVMARPETFVAIKALVAQGGVPSAIYARVKKSADKILTDPLPKYEKPDGKRLLKVSRLVKGRVIALALVYRLDGDPRYAQRAWREMEAAAQFEDWNPSHFLDTAEMTYAFAIGYDWLYDCWTEAQRKILREAISTKGLREGLKVYDSKNRGWAAGEGNWNQVCNGGLVSGALAIADSEPQLAARIVHEAMLSVPLAMKNYAPDGAGTEGVMYWGYGSYYNIVLLSSLETALGTDFGLAQVGAFGLSGYYQLYMCGADRIPFNFSDCSLSKVSEAQHFWLAQKFNLPVFSWFRLSALENTHNRGGEEDLLWFDARGRGMTVPSLPLDRYFRGAECAALRSSWENNALIVGIQAGDSRNLRGHRHLDLGSFIVDALGERWIMDSGTEHETYMKHQQNNPDYAYYRVRAEGHNLPVLNPNKGPDQNPKAVAKVVKFESTPEQVTAVVDLTEAYKPQVRRATRTFTMPERKRLVVTDELQIKKSSELWWFLHTEAEVALSDEGRTATLSRKGKSFLVRLEEPVGAEFKVMDCKPLPSSPNPSQASNGGRKLAVHLNNVQSTRIRVVLEPCQ